MKSPFPTIALLLLLVARATAQQQTGVVPNQNNAWFNGHFWPDALLSSPYTGSEKYNVFYDAMKAANWNWTTVCPQDTDGDGFTNGVELGDPKCVWTKGATPERTTDISLPAYVNSVPEADSICPDMYDWWACSITSNPVDCLAYCKFGCHQNLRPYTCSWDAPCLPEDKPKTIRPWCEFQNEGHRSDPCFVTACDYATNATTSRLLPVDSPCTLGDGRDGKCLASGECRVVVGPPVEIEQLAAPSMTATTIDVTGPKMQSSASVTVMYADGASETATPTLVNSAAETWFYSHTVQYNRMHLVQSVTVSIDGNKRTFGDWHNTNNLIPKIDISCRNSTHWHVTVTPQNWVTAAFLENELNTTRQTALMRTKTGFWFDVSSFGSGELRMRLPIQWGSDIIRTFPCHRMTGSEQCRSPATTVRTAISSCAHRLVDIDGGSPYWIALNVYPISDVETIWCEGVGNLTEYVYSRIGGNPNGKITSRVMMLYLKNGEREYFEATEESMGSSDALRCINGTAKTTIDIQQGPAGQCSAESLCEVPGYLAASGTAPGGCSPDDVEPSTPPVTKAPVTIAPPTDAPTAAPPTDAPTAAPPTVAPTNAPATDAPATDAPTNAPATAAPPTNAPIATSVGTPSPSRIVTATARVHLTGTGYVRLLQERRSELEVALKSDLKRLFRVPSSSLSVNLIYLSTSSGILIIDFNVVGASKATVNARLKELQTVETDVVSVWVDTDALLKTVEPSAGATTIADYSSTDDDLSTIETPQPATPQAAPPTSDTTACATGCQTTIAVCSVVIVGAIIAATVINRRKRDKANTMAGRNTTTFDLPPDADAVNNIDGRIEMENPCVAIGAPSGPVLALPCDDEMEQHAPSPPHRNPQDRSAML